MPLALSFLFISASCSKDGGSQFLSDEITRNELQTTRVPTQIDDTGEYFLDAGFSEGFSVLHPNKGVIRSTGKLTFGKKENLIPEWLVTQWGSNHDIGTEKGEPIHNGYQYSNQAKSISITTDEKGSKTVSLEVKASNDYLKPREQVIDPWIHLYLEQRYVDMQSIADAKELILTYSMRIPYCENKMEKNAYNPGLHAAQAVLYLIVGDINNSAPGQGDFINFCIPLFDNRADFVKQSWHMDSGFGAGDTNKIIYTVGAKDIYATPPGDGQWHDVKIDVLPFIKQAFEVAKQQNCLPETDYDEMGLLQTYVGWEVPGIFDCELQIKNLSLRKIG